MSCYSLDAIFMPKHIRNLEGPNRLTVTVAVTLTYDENEYAIDYRWLGEKLRFNSAFTLNPQQQDKRCMLWST